MSGGNDGEHERSNRSVGESDEGASWPERLLMVTSTVFTILLFAYVIWQGATTPAAAEPTAHVTGTDTLPNGDVRVTVAFRNAQNVGLIMATVEVECETPPPELMFEHVPADGTQTGYVVCPPGTENPNVGVSTWIEA